MNMIEINNRVITPSQAKELHSLGVLQTSQYAWRIDNDTPTLIYDDVDGLPQVIDWSQDKNTYAAYDLCDIGVMLGSLGYYVSGKTYEDNTVTTTAEEQWWASHVQHVCITPEQETYYGATEVEAKAKLLISVLYSPVVPTLWNYFAPKKLKKVNSIHRHYSKKFNT